MAQMTKPSENDYYWSNEPEPHMQRRRDILKDHPEVKQLFGKNPFVAPSTVIIVAIQLFVAANIHLVFQLFDSNILNWGVFLAINYLVGATIAHALFLAIHEVTHDLAFKKTWQNNILAFIANIPIVIPYAMSFKEYHALHHWQQGKDGVDADIPLPGEAKFFKGFFGKVIWFIHQIFFYALRPMFVKPLKLDKWLVLNILFQVLAIGTFFYFFGTWYAAFYLLFSLVLAGGLHPTSGHFISEHYVFEEGQETYSYYGPLNLLTYNVGYHNEHHDFPQVPGNKLPELKKMAPEYYDNLHSYKSWTGVIVRFLTDSSINLFARTKRK